MSALEGTAPSGARGGTAANRLAAALGVGLAAVLGFQALAFLVAGRRAFERLGYPDATRVILASLELGSAILLAIPRTFVVGAVGLWGTLCWAAGFHFALHARNWPLLAGAALLALLMAARAREGRTA